MKQCPVCQSFVFDDIDTCYGCMHRFSMPERDTSSEQGEGSVSQFIPAEQAVLEERYDVSEDESNPQQVSSSGAYVSILAQDKNTQALPLCAATHELNDVATSAVMDVNEEGALSDKKQTKPPRDIQKLNIALNNRETVQITIEVEKTQS